MAEEDPEEDHKPRAEAKAIKKWKYKSRYVDVERLYRLTVNFQDYLANLKLSKELKWTEENKQ